MHSRIATHWLLVDGAHVFGGHEVMLLNLCQELNAQGRVTVHLLARRYGRLREQGGALVTPEAFPSVGAPRFRLGREIVGLLMTPLDAIALIRAMIRIRPSVCVIASGHVLAQAPLVLLARFSKARVVVYVPLIDSFRAMGFNAAAIRESFVRIVYSRVPHAWITITRKQADLLRTWSNIRRPIIALPNSVSAPIEGFANPASANAYARHDEAGEATRIVRVLVLGRLDAYQKGLDLLLESLEQRKDLVDHFNFSIVGEGPYREEIDRRLRSSEFLPRLVAVYGWGDVVHTMRQHDILLIPSRFEGVPLVMLEAMAIGLPVVASDLPGIRAYLPENCLFPVGDIARAVELLSGLRDVENRQQLVRRNRHVVLARASRAVFSKSVGSLTESLMKECSSVS